jgi:hypothetical protein
MSRTVESTRCVDSYSRFACKRSDVSTGAYMGKAEMKCGLFGAVLRAIGQVMYRPCRSLDPEPGAGRRLKAHSLQSEFRSRGEHPQFSRVGARHEPYGKRS